MRVYIHLISMICLLISSAGVCQEGVQRPNDLFPRDFVRKKGTEAEVPSNPVSKVAPIAGPSASSKLPESNSGTGKVRTGNLDELGGDDSNVVKVLSVGALLSISEPEHTKNHIRQLAEFNNQKKVPISKVYLVGPPEKSVEVYARLYRAGFSPNQEDQHESALLLSNQQYLPNVPDAYAGVEYSPTWIIDTEFGMILVEGEQKKLASYFDDKGNFKLGKIKISQESR
jgi:hypothetical protein